jgi:predicted nucleotidyltransferase
MNKFGLTDRQYTMLIRALEDAHVRSKARVFGSRATGRHRYNSDIDIALFGAEERDLSRLRSNLYDSSLPFRYDVVDFDRVRKQTLKDSIVRDSVVV